jgi:hypothetical protein
MPKAKRQMIYWDADCFLGFLKEETDKIQWCKGTTKQAEEGNLIIVTSAITLIEVVKLDTQLRLSADAEKTIKDFFKNPYIYIHNVDAEVGIIARDLIWKHTLSQRDSIHVATALKLKLNKMHTFDEQLHKLSNKYGNPKLIICKPDIEHQMNFDDL